MPITPYHVLPGIFLKAMLRGSFSLMVFAYANVLMDIQPFVKATWGVGELHGWTHTWWAAVVIGAFAGFTGKWLVDVVLWYAARDNDRPRLRLGWWIAFVSAYLGTLSHVALDSTLYADLHPLEPWSDAQPWLGIIMSSTAERACFVAGFVGMVIYVLGPPLLQRWRARVGGSNARPTA